MKLPALLCGLLVTVGVAHAEHPWQMHVLAGVSTPISTRDKYSDVGSSFGVMFLRDISPAVSCGLRGAVDHWGMHVDSVDPRIAASHAEYQFVP